MGSSAPTDPPISDPFRPPLEMCTRKRSRGLSTGVRTARWTNIDGSCQVQSLLVGLSVLPSRIITLVTNSDNPMYPVFKATLLEFYKDCSRVPISHVSAPDVSINYNLLKLDEMAKPKELKPGPWQETVCAIFKRLDSSIWERSLFVCLDTMSQRNVKNVLESKCFFVVRTYLSVTDIHVLAPSYDGTLAFLLYISFKNGHSHSLTIIAKSGQRGFLMSCNGFVSVIEKICADNVLRFYPFEKMGWDVDRAHIRFIVGAPNNPKPVDNAAVLVGRKGNKHERKETTEAPKCAVYIDQVDLNDFYMDEGEEEDSDKLDASYEESDSNDEEEEEASSGGTDQVADLTILERLSLIDSSTYKVTFTAVNGNLKWIAKIEVIDGTEHLFCLGRRLRCERDGDPIEIKTTDSEISDHVKHHRSCCRQIAKGLNAKFPCQKAKKKKESG